MGAAFLDLSLSKVSRDFDYDFNDLNDFASRLFDYSTSGRIAELTNQRIT